jgi:uncharacterized membrane protein YphA (DoxX/SURF4 family)
LRWDLFLTAKPLGFVAAVLVVTAGAAVLQRRLGRELIPAPEFFGATAQGKRRVYAVLPAILGVHAAVPMLVIAMNNRLFTPNALLAGASAYVAALAEILIALAFLYGALTRLAAVVLALLWAAGVFLVGAQTMLDDILYLGIAAFFWLCGRGPYALDRYLFPRYEPEAKLVRNAIPALRMSVGLSFVIVAFTEKFANIPYGLAFLHQYPVNFSAAAGIPLSDETFLLCAGSVELLVGLWLLFGIWQREIILIGWLPFNLSLTYFHATEFIGHLPIYGVMALLLIWNPSPQSLADWTAALSRVRHSSEKL